MTLELINPPDLPMPNTYTQVVVATGSRLVFVAGQEPEDAKGRLVGPGDLAVQARQAFANLSRALTAAGAEPDEVAQITIYVVDYESVRHDGLMRLPWQPSEYTRTCTECGYTCQNYRRDRPMLCLAPFRAIAKHRGFGGRFHPRRSCPTRQRCR